MLNRAFLPSGPGGGSVLTRGGAIVGSTGFDPDSELTGGILLPV